MTRTAVAAIAAATLTLGILAGAVGAVSVEDPTIPTCAEMADYMADHMADMQAMHQMMSSHIGADMSSMMGSGSDGHGMMDDGMMDFDAEDMPMPGDNHGQHHAP